VVCTVVNIDLTVDAGKAWRTDTAVRPHLVQTLPSVLAGVGIALVDLPVTGGAAPARRAVADELGHLVLAGAPVAGVVPALVLVSLAPLPIPARLAPAGVVIDQVRALPVIEAGVGGALVDVLLAQPPPVAWLALTSVPIYLIHTVPLVKAGVGGALVHIHLTVLPIGAGLAVALIPVSISELLTGAPVLARVDLTLVNLPVTESASIARVAAAGEVIDTVDTDTIEAVVARTVVDVPLAPVPREAFGAVTGEGAAVIMTHSPIITGVGSTVINVDLAVGATEPVDTGAVVGIDPVSADPVIPAGV